ncbi:MAG: twitch domain-containing radical SAM protein [Proteobacteria bacterium]|nr:twitch domain-containing radical SAM protein [Pseudomonadota bacterium]NBP14179.1 twitch domain-containing radical SAM protein [bacterium]
MFKEKLKLKQKYLLEESKHFCILPWLHIHSVPNGNVSPCCISYPGHFTGKVKSETRLMELVNSDPMKQLRLNMVDDKPSTICKTCYNTEAIGGASFRQHSNKIYAQFYERAVSNSTEESGNLTEFKMNYFDFRFSTICNFKCRTCTSDYSSQWEQENVKHKKDYVPIRREKSTPLLDDIIEQIPNMHEAYFAGGEILITDEHYTLLENMIAKGKTDTILKYNTNLSVFNFKDKNLIDLWKQFKFPISIGGSLDHYGSRAEYLRHGTDWNKIADNIRYLKSNLGSKADLCYNTVLSVFNVLTLQDFYKNLVRENLYDPTIDGVFSIYKISSPSYYSPHILNLEEKSYAIGQIEQLINFFRLYRRDRNRFESIKKVLEDTITFLKLDIDLSKEIDMFKQETLRLDQIRKENFVDIFPELKRLVE